MLTYVHSTWPTNPSVMLAVAPLTFALVPGPVTTGHERFSSAQPAGRTSSTTEYAPGWRFVYVRLCPEASVNVAGVRPPVVE